MVQENCSVIGQQILLPFSLYLVGVSGVTANTSSKAWVASRAVSKAACVSRSCSCTSTRPPGPLPCTFHTFTDTGHYHTCHAQYTMPYLYYWYCITHFMLRKFNSLKPGQLLCINYSYMDNFHLLK